MSNNLNDFIKNNQKFIKLEDGESFTGNFLGSRVIPSKFDPDKETVEYGFEIEGRKMIFTSGNIAVAQDMMQLKKGDEVTIKRIAKGKFEVTSPVLNVKEGFVQNRKTEPQEPASDDDVPF